MNNSPNLKAAFPPIETPDPSPEELPDPTPFEFLKDPKYDPLISFFRQIIDEDFGYSDVKDAHPYHVLIVYIGARLCGSHVSPRFIQSEILGPEITAKLNQYNLKLNDKHELDPDHLDSNQIYDNLVRYFNPNILYTHFEPYQKNGPNLSVLHRNSLTEEDKKQIIQRGEQWLELLYPLERKNPKPGTEDPPQNLQIESFYNWRFTNTIESLIAKIDPSIERDFIHKGEVVGFSESLPPEWNEEKFFKMIDAGKVEFPTAYGIPGLMVNGFDQSWWDNLDLLPLTNTNNPARFQHLIGRHVHFHYTNFVRTMVGTPYGELIHVPEENS